MTLAAVAGHVDSGDTAWMLVATALVLMMTPALGLFYAGLVRSKNTLNTFMMSIAAIAVAMVTWFLVGYSLAFDGTGSIVGGLGHVALHGVGFAPREGTKIPQLVFMAFLSALAAALVVGARKGYGRQALLPHNAVYVLLGAGLLWFGWFGFNGGSGFSTGHNSVLAFANTLITPACSLVTWFALDLIRGRKVTAIGAATAIIVGCVLITPAGGFISPGWAMALGFLGALPCYAMIVWRPRTRVEETLDVLAAHGVAGFTGILFIGFFAQLAWNGASDGLFYGDTPQLVHQAPAALVGPAYAFSMTFLLLKLIGLVMPLRASEHEEAIGTDVTYHGEEAYVTGEGVILVVPEDGGRVPVPVTNPG